MEHLPVFWAQGGVLIYNARKPAFSEGKNRDAWITMLLRHTGTDSYVFLRPGPHEMTLPADLFDWRPPDDSSVTAFRIPFAYHTAREAVPLPQKIDLELEMMRQQGTPFMCFYGVGNHGGGPTREHIATIDERRAAGQPVVFSDPKTFFEERRGQPLRRHGGCVRIMTTFLQHLDSAIDTFARLRELEPAVEEACDTVVHVLASGGRIFACGNGGSAAEAQHFVTELVGRYRLNREPLPALFLGGDTGQMTCIANDYHWDDVFARPLRAFAKEGDLLFCFSTSGQSSNVVAALQAARSIGVQSLAFLGKDGGSAAALADKAIIVPATETARIQECHLFLLHWLCERIDERFTSGPPPSRMVGAP